MPFNHDCRIRVFAAFTAHRYFCRRLILVSTIETGAPSPISIPEPGRSANYMSRFCLLAYVQCRWTFAVFCLPCSCREQLHGLLAQCVIVRSCLSAGLHAGRFTRASNDHEEDTMAPAISCRRAWCGTARSTIRARPEARATRPAIRLSGQRCGRATRPLTITVHPNTDDGDRTRGWHPTSRAPAASRTPERAC